MLEFIAWLIVLGFSIPLLSFVTIAFFVALMGAGGKHTRYYDDEDDAYVVMPDGTVRFDTGG